MNRPLLLLLAAALLAVPAAAQMHIANPASDQLRGMSNLMRRAALRGALLDSGQACKRVEKAALQGPYGNLMMWRAQCSWGTRLLDYAVFVGPDASIQARPCTDMAATKLPRCRPFN